MLKVLKTKLSPENWLDAALVYSPLFKFFSIHLYRKMFIKIEVNIEIANQ